MRNRNITVSCGSFTDIGRLTPNDISTEIQMAFNTDITDRYNNVIDLNLLVSINSVSNTAVLDT